jgi:subtilisin family serine protease
MKPHLVVTLRPDAARPDRPHWTEVMRDKSGAGAALNPALAALFRRFDLPVWTTREYKRQGDAWSAEELAAGLDRVYRVILQQDRQIPRGLIAQIRLIPDVAAARPGEVGVVRIPPALATALARDPADAARRSIRLPEAHRITRGDQDIMVAVLDTGIDLVHPEYRGRVEGGADFVDIINGASEFFGDFVGADEDASDEVGHGTHVTGIIVAEGARMPTGVAPKCRVLPVRVLGALRRGDELVGAGLIENINAGVKYAVDRGADVINMSLGVRQEGGGLPHQEVVDYATRKGVTIVAAAGNDGHEGFYYPGAFPSVIAVGSMDREGQVSAFSTYGPQVSLIAPGEEIYSTHLDHGYAHATGTSHAAPFVAGAAALLRSLARERGGRLSARQTKQMLIETADKVDRQLKDRKAGFGRLNIPDALRHAAAVLN